MRVINVDELLKRLYRLYEARGLTSECTGDDWNDGASCFFDDVIDIVSDLPLFECPTKQGRWIKGCCSECGTPLATNNTEIWLSEWDNEYCYNCGAKMRGE